MRNSPQLEWEKEHEGAFIASKTVFMQEFFGIVARKQYRVFVEFATTDNKPSYGIEGVVFKDEERSARAKNTRDVCQ